MPEQYPYPEVGWSTGKIRKQKKSFLSGEADVGEAARNFESSPLIDSIAKQHQERMKAQGIPEQMKGVLPRSGVGAAEVRELEGLRKEKTQHLSQAEGQYDTQLSEAEETAFKAWKKKWAPNDSGADYDLRGAFRSGFKPDPDTGHWPDTYKKPNHPTFSDQSIYAKDRPDLAGRWEGDTYIPAGKEI